MSKILIVEDEESIADLEKDYLELSGLRSTIRSLPQAEVLSMEKKRWNI